MSGIINAIINGLLDAFFLLISWLVDLIATLSPSWTPPTFVTDNAFTRYGGMVAYFIPVDYFLTLVSAYFTLFLIVKVARALLSIPQIDV
jgi:hypothetical protein